MYENKFWLLVKRGLKDSYKNVLIINAVLLGACILIGILVSIISSETFATPLGLFLTGMFALAIYCIILAAFIILLVIIFKTMYQRLFTKEGYLTFTLPVTIDQLIISKIIVNLIWIIGTVIVFSLGLSFVILVQPNNLLFDTSNITILKTDFTSNLLEILGYVVNIVMYLVLLFMVLAIANQSSKAKVIIAIILFIAIAFGISNIEDILLLLFMYATENTYIYTIISIIIETGFTIGFYFIGRNIVKNKLELL